MLPKIPASNYTQIPNVVIERMCEFTHTEFKVAMMICRYTLGFHRPTHRMSLTFLENGTGLHRETVSNALQTLNAKGFLVKEAVGNSYGYALNFEVDALSEGSRRFRPLLVGDSDQQVVGDSDSRKKEDKETERKSPISSGVCVRPTREVYEEFLSEEGYPVTKDYDQIPWDEIYAKDWKPFVRALHEKMAEARNHH